MSSNASHIQTISECLAQSLDPDPYIQKRVEAQLKSAKRLPGFGDVLITITQDSKTGSHIRHSSALAFKNWIKLSWSSDDETDPQISASDRDALKAKLVAVVISLRDLPHLQVQYQEAISIIADVDFPGSWPALIDQLVQNFTPTDWKINNALLSTAHVVFKKWRSQFRTDDLFLEIKYVLERFCSPYLQLFKMLDNTLTNSVTTLPLQDQRIVAQSLLLMIQIYYDLNSQDIPEFFEDNLSEFMSLLHKYLTWDTPALVTPDYHGDEEGEAGELEKIKASICEVLELYSQRYLDLFPMMGSFVETCWGMLISLGRQGRYDILVSKAVRFLSVVVRMPSQRHLFENPSTLEAFCEKIVLPNMLLRDHEVEMFEDDPVEYVRRDLEGANIDTRRQAATEFTRALMEQFENQITGIVTKYVQSYLEQYAQDPVTHWRAKDAAVSLLASVASRSSTAAAGVTSTNALVDVVKFYSEHVVPDITPCIVSRPHPIIVADAIKFLHTFRNQLTRAQLVPILPQLTERLSSKSFVIHTYAASTLERILFIKERNRLIFVPGDVQDYSRCILIALFKQMRAGIMPQQISQNDTLMKCVMRVILTTKYALRGYYQEVLNSLIEIITEISRNPSNPKFNHYTFESVSALIRSITMMNIDDLSTFEQALFPVFSSILTLDVQDFSPFVFQILSQMLELRTNQSQPLSDYYFNLLQPLLTPTLWEVRGNVPALVRLLKAYLGAGSARIMQENRVPAMLGVFQKLIGSKLNDVYGFELLQALFEHVTMDALGPYLRNVFVLLLTRLQQSKTEKFTSALLYTIMFIMTLEKPLLTPDVIINTINAVQPGLFSQVMEGVILPAVSSTPLKHRRVVALGHVSLLTRSRALQHEAEARLYLPILTSALQLFTLPQLSPTTTAETDSEEVNVADLEENGYQVGFSRLGASEPLGAKKDLFDAIGDPRDALARGLIKAGEVQPGKIPALIAQVPSDFGAPYLQWLAAAGYQIR